MELPSKTIKRETDSTPYSTLVGRHTRWFDHYYIDRLEEPKEIKTDIILEVGKIYTFAYDPIFKDELDFFSYVPINLILGTKLSKAGNLIPYGINLSFVPPTIRIQILDEIVRIWNTDIIKPNIERINQGLPVLHNIPLFYDVAKKILEGSGFEFAIRGYRYERFGSLPRVVSYEDWYKLCYFSIKYISKMQIRQIYYRYQQALKENYRIGHKAAADIQKKKIKEVKEYFKKRERY